MKEQNKSSRLFGLDVARLFAMIMMVQGHTVFCLLSGGILEQDVWYWNLYTFIRGFTAPIFLMVSGVVHIFANKRNAQNILPFNIIKKRVKICLMLLVVGYLMQFPANNIFDTPFLSDEALFSLFKTNVLQMIGVTLLFLTLLFYLINNNDKLGGWCFFIGNILIILSHFSLQIHWYDYLPIPLASFLSVDNGSIFPLLPFSGYLLIGAFIGTLIQQIPVFSIEYRNKHIIKYFFLIGLPYIVIGFIVHYWYDYNGYSVIGKSTIPVGISIYRVGVAMWICALATLTCKAFTPIQKTISMLSKRSLFIYVFHLLLIYGSPISPGLRHIFFNTNTLTAFYCAVFVIFFSILIVYLYDKSVKNPNASNLYKYLIVALLIYMLLI